MWCYVVSFVLCFFFFQAEDGIRDLVRSRGLGDVYKRQDHNQLIEKYKHPLWDKLKAGIEKYGGHGGMDFVMIYRLIDSLNNGWFLDQDVYDAASWSVVIPLSTLSIELGSTPLKFPDFTRGRWNENRELGILKNY